LNNKITIEQFEKSKRIVIKIGSSLIVDQKNNSIKESWLLSLASDVSLLKNNGKDVVIVSSGSIALGRRILNLSNKLLQLEESQAAAAVGQIYLANAYKKILSKFNLITGQILVTSEDSQNRKRYLNTRSTFATLLNYGVVPIVNENDTVATDEIKFGDNDRLASQVASICDANMLILLSDVDGLYTSNPKKYKDAKHIEKVVNLSKEIHNFADESDSIYSKGGMKTKIDAAKFAMSSGISLVITEGTKEHSILNLLNGQKCTWFLPTGDVQTSRKQWILSNKAKGKIFIDKGAKIALQNGKSLLPAGIIKTEGSYKRGDTVEILSEHSESIGKGLICYNSLEVNLIKGCQSNKIKEVLGHVGRSVLIHRDDLAM